MNDNNPTRLQIRRLIPASPEEVFQAWTNPEALKHWWGPKGVRCVDADIELRVGGDYRIVNELPDGSILVISGQFTRIEEPNLLSYTWATEAEGTTEELVSIRFQAHGRHTELVLTHDLVPTQELRDQHQNGWIGCLDGLEHYCSESRAARS